MKGGGNNRPIIIKRKKAGGHGGHHGGAWKVAYADFVTAMMAFFLVMWILGLSESTRKGISGYFREPGIFSYTTTKGQPIEIQGATSTHRGDGSGEAGKPSTGKDGQIHFAVGKSDMEALAGKVRGALALATENDPRGAKAENAVTVQVTSEGLRVELAESPNVTFFDVGGATPSPITKKVLAAVAGELKRVGNPLQIEGHTDSRPYGARASYTNWELSSDRAQAARKLLVDSGLPDAQVAAVVGHADRRLRYPDRPLDVGNRRISIVVAFPPNAPQPSTPPQFKPISPLEIQGAFKRRGEGGGEK